MSRVPNAGGKVLLENWFEERATKGLGKLSFESDNFVDFQEK